MLIAVCFAFIEKFIYGTGRLYGPLKMDPNTFGIMCLFAINFVYKLQLKYRNFIISIFILAILFTLSRTASGFLISYLLYKNLVVNKKLNAKKILFISLGLPIFIAAVIYFSSQRNINAESSSFVAELTSGRSILFLMGLEMTYNNPILGNGAGVFIEESKRLRNAFTQGTSWGEYGIAGAAHNTYIEVLVGVGIIGLLVYISFIKMLYSRIINQEDRILFIFLLLALFTLSEEFNRIFWLIVPILIYSDRGNKENVYIKNH
jgi:O-antigen ligase